MQWLTTTAVVVLAVLVSPTAALAITFGEWASDQGYSSGDVMPGYVNARESSIDDLSCNKPLLLMFIVLAVGMVFDLP